VTSTPIKKPRGLTRALVLAKSVELADELGLKKLSMRSLANALGVEAMSLYNHVKNKDDLIGGMAEHVVQEFYLPRADAPWKGELRKRALATYDTLKRHPWASQVLVSTVTDGPANLTYVDATLGCLRGAGFSYEQADRIWNMLDSHIYGFTLQELRFPFEPAAFQEVAASYLPHIDAATMPHLHGLTGEVARGDYTGIHDVTFGLDILLDAVGRLPRDN